MNFHQICKNFMQTEMKILGGRGLLFWNTLYATAALVLFQDHRSSYHTNQGLISLKHKSSFSLKRGTEGASIEAP